MRQLARAKHRHGKMGVQKIQQFAEKSLKGKLGIPQRFGVRNK